MNNRVIDKCHFFWFSGQPCKILPGFLLAVIVTCFGSSMLFGYNMAVLNNIELEVKIFLRETVCQMNIDNCSAIYFPINMEFQYAFLTSAYIISGVVGCFCSGFISDKFGRRNTLISNNIIGVIGGGCSLLVMWTRSKLNMFIGRLILGVNAGITTGVAPLFLAEISPTVIRGGIIAGHQLCITIGITLAYLLTMKFTQISSDTWITTLALPMIPSALSFALLFLVPESPRYLLLSKNDHVAAIKSCFHYNQTQTTSEQLQEMRKEVENQSFKFWYLFTKKKYRIGIVVSLTINIMQQFSGINAIISYSKHILLDTHFSEKSIEYSVLGIGVLNFIASIISIPLIEKKGRRNLLIYPSLICIICLIGIFLSIGIIPKYLQFHSQILPFISLGFINVFIICFALGLGPIPSVLVAEMFTQTPRAVTYSMCLGVQWACTYIILLFYPIVNSILPPGYIFIVFAGLTAVFLIVLIIYMPETKNQSFIQISENLQTKSKILKNLVI